MREVDYNNWIDEKRFKKLSKLDSKNLLNRQRNKGLITKKTKKIERLKKILKDDREELRNLKDEFNYWDREVSGLFDNLYFSCSIIENKYRYINRKKLPVRIKGTSSVTNLRDKIKKKHPTYYLCVNRKKNRPKNIYLGREDKIRKHLSKYYKDDKWLSSGNWKRELLNTSHKGNISHDVLFDLIRKSPSKFMELKITLETLYPIK